MDKAGVVSFVGGSFGDGARCSWGGDIGRDGVGGSSDEGWGMEMSGFGEESSFEVGSFAERFDGAVRSFDGAFDGTVIPFGRGFDGKDVGG